MPWSFCIFVVGKDLGVYDRQQSAVWASLHEDTSLLAARYIQSRVQCENMVACHLYIL